MTEYTTQSFDLVHNQQYEFRKLYIDGECQFDEFMKTIERNGNKKEITAFASIIAYMNMFSDSILLPKTKFRHIESVGRNDVYEFKKDNIRIYVVMQRPNVYVVLGGYKNSQKKDIKNLARKVADFKI